MRVPSGQKGHAGLGGRLIAALALWAGANAPVLAADPVRVGAILNNPPYVIENPSGGIDNDIIRRAFLQSGQEVEFNHAPISRLDALLEDHKVDAVTTFALSRDDCALSDPFSFWHDGITVRSEMADKIKSLADLKGLSVGTFPNAEQALGPDFGAAVKTFARRIVIFRTDLVWPMLERDRIDAYIGDYWALDHAFDSQFGLKPKVKPYKVVFKFPLTARRLCFNDPTLAAAFNRGLAVLRQTGTYDAIIAMYRGGNQ